MSGVSRSPSVVIAYLMKCNQWSLMQSLRYLQQRRPCVKLTPPVQEQLLEFERQVRSRARNVRAKTLRLVFCSSRACLLHLSPRCQRIRCSGATLPISPHSPVAARGRPASISPPPSHQPRAHRVERFSSVGSHFFGSTSSPWSVPFYVLAASPRARRRRIVAGARTSLTFSAEGTHIFPTVWAFSALLYCALLFLAVCMSDGRTRQVCDGGVVMRPPL
jgi:hypothetical protein